MSAWVTNDIEPGQLILDSDVPEDLGLQLYSIPDTSSPSGHAEDTNTIKDPRGGSPITRTAKHHAHARDISYSSGHPPDAFLDPFRHGFHRELVTSTNGKRSSTYYLTEEGVRLRSRNEVGPYIKHFEGLTKDSFNFMPVRLPIVDPTNRYQSTRSANPTRRSIPRIVHEEQYQSDDSTHSAEEARRHKQKGPRWEQDACWGQQENIILKQEFDPSPYNTDAVRHKDRDWRQRKPIIPSSDENEEETHQETRHVAQDNILFQKLADMKVRNKILLSNMDREDVKQEPIDYIKPEPDNYTQPPQRTQHQRITPKREPQKQMENQWSNAHDYRAPLPPRPNGNRQNSIPNQPSAHHRHEREMPREYGDWDKLEPSPKIGGNPPTGLRKIPQTS